jgi:hypothetical protein
VRTTCPTGVQCVHPGERRLLIRCHPRAWDGIFGDRLTNSVQTVWVFSIGQG